MIYAGIGSRQTPTPILERMEEISKSFNEKGYMLRSGGAVGADTAFSKHSTNKEIFIPWNGFNGLWEDDQHFVVHDPDVLQEAESIMKTLHPNYHALGVAARKLHTRNVFQILGADLKTPVDLVVYWAPKGAGNTVLGGTATAVKLARKLKIREYYVEL